MVQTADNQQEEWLKILSKGLITIPKAWRQELGLETGNIIKARKVSGKIVIEPVSPPPQKAPYRIYSKEEIAQFLKDDKL